jgi:hypothetical protein
MPAEIAIRPITREEFYTEFNFRGGRAGVHKELEWWVTESGRVRGVLILDLIDDDYSRAVLTREYQEDAGWPDARGNVDGSFAAVDLGINVQSRDAARAQLKAAMGQAERNPNTP